MIEAPTLELSRDELIRITGCKRPRDQAEWVSKHYGCRAYVNAANECIVIRAHLEAAREPEQTRPSVRQVRRQG